jgi:hypothetical protein
MAEDLTIFKYADKKQLEEVRILNKQQSFYVGMEYLSLNFSLYIIKSVNPNARVLIIRDALIKNLLSSEYFIFWRLILSEGRRKYLEFYIGHLFSKGTSKIQLMFLASPFRKVRVYKAK